MNATPPSFTDCYFHAGSFYSTLGHNFTNALFERTGTTMDGMQLNDAEMHNCLFWNGYLNLTNGADNFPVFHDNLFEKTHISTSLHHATADYNAYISGYSIIATGAHDVTLSASPAYQTGAFGNYYQPTNSGLIDKGSTWATNVCLYQFTTITNALSKEASTMLDIGLHFAAADTNSLPASTSGDGLGDWFKDSNGNGVYDTADVGNWKTNDTCGDGISDYIKYIQGRNLRVGTTNDVNGVIGLNVFTPLK